MGQVPSHRWNYTLGVRLSIGIALNSTPLLQMHATAATASRSGNRRPWLPDFLMLSGVPKRLSRRVEQIIEDVTLLHGRPLQVVRLKPTLGIRRLTLLELEAEAAATICAAPLVRALEEQRVESISFANQVIWSPKIADAWQLAPFSPSSDSYRRFREQRLSYKEAHGWIGETDVKHYFPSVALGVVSAYARSATGLTKQDINKPLTLLRAVGGQPGMLPVGPDLASVIGTHLLTPADRWCSWALGPTAAVRWVDDITFGTGSEAYCWTTLAFLEAGPVKNLGCRLHPAKTLVAPAEAWNPSAKISLFEPDSVIAQQPGAGAQLMTRNHVRYRLDEINAEFGHDPEHAAVTIASELPAMLADVHTATRTMSDYVDGALPASVADTASISLLPAAQTVYSDEVAEALLDVSAKSPSLTAEGRRALIGLAADANIPARTRAAAGWTLAQTGTFDAAVLDQVNNIRPYGARALVTAAARAGHSPSQHELGQAIN
jgi:hypothetical protein